MAESTTVAGSSTVSDTTTMAGLREVAESPAESAGDTLRAHDLPIRRSPKPIFVDASGGRRRRLRILVAAAVTPAVACVVLLVSTLMGGPALPALLPQAVRPKPRAVAAPGQHQHRARTSRTVATGAAALHRGPAGATTVSQGTDHARATAKGFPTVAPFPSPKPSATARPSPSRTPSPTRSPRPTPSHSPHPSGTPTAFPTHGGLGLA